MKNLLQNRENRPIFHFFATALIFGHPPSIDQHSASRLLIIEVVKFALLQGFVGEKVNSFEPARSRLRTFIVVADFWHKGVNGP